MQNARQTIRADLCRLRQTNHFTFASVRAVPNLGTAAESVQPITTETVPPPGSAIVNPAVVASNGLARYTIDVVPPGIPDSDIVWSVAEGAGNIQFYNTGNKGRAVNVQGKAEGGFKLEVDIAGLTLDPKPYIYGRVEEQTVTPLHFIIITSNGVPAVTESEIDKWIVEANLDYRQVAMTFTKANVKHLEKPEWFNIPNDNTFYAMCSYTNNTGGLEVYCVNTLPGAVGLHSDRRLPAGSARRGLAVTAGAPVSTMGHEIGHACGLSDITINRLGNTLVNKDLVGEKNWSGGDGTGYYPRDLKHADLVSRLLMCQGSESRGDIPLGAVRAYYGQHPDPLPISVGVDSMGDRTPRH
ncbi:MAG: hypothetical protein FWH21_06940 [Kiritimatiellaeota bacterium]|nr:hypothetical protein [Kiritimatiellota bacterium]